MVPDRRTLASSQSRSESRQVAWRGKHSGCRISVMDSFAALGVICGVVGPSQPQMEMMRQADIVVLDWRLKEEDPKYTLKLLNDLLTGEEDRYSLRLVAIYTGEARLEKIYKSIFHLLEEDGLDPKENGSRTAISYRHGRVVLYAKSSVNLAGHLKERRVSEEKLPNRLVKDFAAMTEGLLPGIALSSLTAVREGAHKVLDRFCAELDPAFLTHRVCLPNPDDAERQIVNHLAEELRGLMDNAVAGQRPAGAEAVEKWVRRSNGEGGCFVFGPKEKKLSLEDRIKLAKEGLAASKKLNEKEFEGLSDGFAGRKVDDLDERLAWIMSFQTVYNEPAPTLWLGSVVTVMDDGEEQHLICMRPRCDCVRLKTETTFFFLPLVETKKGKQLRDRQLVVRIGKEFVRLGIEIDPCGWVLRKFEPSHDRLTVTATARTEGKERKFDFKDTCERLYRWQGELKAEYAQRIVQDFTTQLSRVPVDESEWIRRMAKKGG